MRSFEAGLAAIAADRQSGSRAITHRLVELLLGAPWPSEVSATSFADRSRAVLRALPSFALVHDLLHTTGAALYGASAGAEVKAQRVCREIARWRSGWQAAQEATTAHAAARVPAGATVVTLSNSSAVAALCGALAREGRPVRVIVGESHPGGEGAVFARGLPGISTHVALVPDAELPGMVEAALAVVLGADVVCADRFVNKVGSAELAKRASGAGRPVWVLAETAKWAPEAWGIETGAAPLETLFESIDGRLVDLLVSERGALPFASAARELDKKPVFGPLRPA